MDHLTNSASSIFAFVMLGALFVVPLIFLLKMKSAGEKDAMEPYQAEANNQGNEDSKGEGAGGKKGRKNRGGLAAMKKDKDITPGSSTTAAAAEDEPVYDADGNIDTTGMTKAEIRKMEKKQEKAELRQFDQQQRDAYKEAEEAKIAARKQKDKEREEKQRLKEEVEKKAKEEEEKKQQEEFNKWRTMMTVDDEGSGEAEETSEDKDLLRKFVLYIKEHKVVMLEDLAAEFNLHVQDCISRVQGLELMGYVTGVIDDRGKFIYVSEEELSKVAKFINRKGRVSIAAIAAESNKLLDLDAKKTEQDEKDIEEAELETEGQQ